MTKFSFIDPEYRANIIFSIDRYQILKPDARQEEVDHCLALVNLDSYHTHSLLINALKNYLASITTGFKLFGVESLRIKTGHSLLKTFILEALKTKTMKQLLDYEESIVARIRELDHGESHEALLAQNTDLSRQLSLLQRQYDDEKKRLCELQIQYQILQSEKLELEKTLLESMSRGEDAMVGNLELNGTILSLLEENKELFEENKCLRLSQAQERGAHKGYTLFSHPPG
jgi:hypothetical protein